MAAKQKLELTWIGKETRPRLEPRILLEDPEKSYHAKFRVKEKGSREGAKSAKKSKDSENLGSSSPLRGFAPSRENDPGDIFDNRLIFGDNLLALKALEQEFSGKQNRLDPPSGFSQGRTVIVQPRILRWWHETEKNLGEFPAGN